MPSHDLPSVIQIQKKSEYLFDESLQIDTIYHYFAYFKARLNQKIIVQF